jgi:hypothetical protein
MKVEKRDKSNTFLIQKINELWFQLTPREWLEYTNLINEIKPRN